VARDYEPWDMTDDTRSALNRVVRDNTYPDLGEIRGAADVRRVEARYGREALTAQLAGTTDRGTRAWKNARDNLSRWRTGRRTPSAASASRLGGGVRGLLGGRYRGYGSLHVELTATITTSRTSWSGKMYADLTGADLEDYLTACEGGNWEEAAMIVADAYGLDPEYILSLDEVHGFDVTPPTDEED
jgi:hypothetical protein